MRKIKVGDAVHAIMNKKVMLVTGIMGNSIVDCVWLGQDNNLLRGTFKSQSLYLIDDFRLKPEIQKLKEVLSRDN